MKILVTGGSGFLGSNVIKTIHEAHPEFEVFSLDLKPNPNTQATFIEADITSPNAVQEALSSVKPDVVVHTAGFVPNGQSRYSSDPDVRAYVFNINVNGTKNMLAASKAARVQAFVYTSSCTVISDDLAHDYPFMNESLPTGYATLAYGASKGAAEKLVLAANCDEMVTCALRPSTVIGPGDNYGVIDTIYNLVPNWQSPFVIGDGNNMYDFVYIDNIAYAHLLAVENLIGKKTAAGLAMFISNQEPIYFRDFMLAVFANCGDHVPPFQMEIPAGLAKWFGWIAEWASWAVGKEVALSRGSVQDALGTRYSDNARAIQILGYRPKVALRDGVRLACEDFKRRRADAASASKTTES